jgi:large subunit ribosomal protein L18
VIASVHSRELAKQGWKGSTNSLPACYLTGLLLGKKAQAKGTNKGILYIGKDHFTSRVAACVKGIADSGLNIPVGEESFPDGDRITGQHIADYANTLKADQDAYNSRFSALLKNGLKPEDYPAHFEEVRFKISGKAAEPKAPKKEKKAEAPAGKEATKEKKEKVPKKEAKEEGKKSDKGAKKK